jgi:hypothetical protein
MTAITFRAGRYGDGPEIVVDADDWRIVSRYTWTASRLANTGRTHSEHPVAKTIAKTLVRTGLK